MFKAANNEANGFVVLPIFLDQIPLFMAHLPLSPKDLVAFADAVLGIVWAWNFAGLLGQQLLRTAREVLLRGARAMDSGKGTRLGRCAAPGTPAEDQWKLILKGLKRPPNLETHPNLILWNVVVESVAINDIATINE